MVSMHPWSDAPTPINKDSHTPPFHPRTFSALPEPVGPTEEPNTAERKDISGLLVNHNPASDFTFAPDVSSLPPLTVQS